MENLPKYYLLDRRLLGHIGAAKRIVEALSALSTLSAYPAVTGLLIVLRAALSYYESVSGVNNPINISATQTITTPQPITPPDHVDIPAR